MKNSLYLLLFSCPYFYVYYILEFIKIMSQTEVEKNPFQNEKGYLSLFLKNVGISKSSVLKDFASSALAGCG